MAVSYKRGTPVQCGSNSRRSSLAELPDQTEWGQWPHSAQKDAQTSHNHVHRRSGCAGTGERVCAFSAVISETEGGETKKQTYRDKDIHNQKETKGLGVGGERESDTQAEGGRTWVVLAVCASVHQH